MKLSPAVQLEHYVAMVETYSNTLDLSSPEVIKELTWEIEKARAYESHIRANACILDIGSGVGLPGIPIAVRRPDVQITLCEIRRRRAAFLEIVVGRLRLENVTVYNGDVQKLRGNGFDIIIAQAVGRLAHVYRLGQHLITPSWMLLSRKGANLTEEIEEIQKIAPVNTVIQEKLDSDSTLVCVQGGVA
jgi:16S rRNA (guanine527-N7)-methyltransferase